MEQTNERPKNHVVHTVTGKQIALTESETNLYYTFIDMNMPKQFISNWLYDVVSMHNADDRMSMHNADVHNTDDRMSDDRMKIERISADYAPSKRERQRDLMNLIVNTLLIAIIVSGLFYLIVTL